MLKESAIIKPTFTGVNMQEKFKDQTKLKARLRKAGFKSRDVANRLGLHPNTVRTKLCGLSRFTDVELQKIETLLTKASLRSTENT
jgi:lambda repressor-like predicted transcriptional regulator